MERGFILLTPVLTGAGWRPAGAGGGAAGHPGARARCGGCAADGRACAISGAHGLRPAAGAPWFVLIMLGGLTLRTTSRIFDRSLGSPDKMLHR